MPAPAKLVTLTQAKARLYITLPEGDPGDSAIQDILNEAEAVILAYLTDTPGRDTWIDPTTAPGQVTAAIQVMLVYFHERRGDDETDFLKVWRRVEVLLAQLHVEALA